LQTYELRLLNHSLSSSSLFKSSINVLTPSKIISILCPLAKHSRVQSLEVGVVRPPSCETEDIRISDNEHRSKAYKSESGMTVLAVSSNRLPMIGILFSIRQKLFNGLFIIVMLLTLDND
jgi:hypothetical protein